MSRQRFTLLPLLINVQKGVRRGHHCCVFVEARWSRGPCTGCKKREKLDGKKSKLKASLPLILSKSFQELAGYSQYQHASLAFVGLLRLTSNCKNRFSRKKSGFLYSSSRWQTLSFLFILSVLKQACSSSAMLKKTSYTTGTIQSVLGYQFPESSASFYRETKPWMMQNRVCWWNMIGKYNN